MKRNNQSGSALVLTVLMVSIMSTVSFSITALAISELRKASALEDSIVAYYAAESGIEHGLLQYRLWRNAEISQELNDYMRQQGGTLPLPEQYVPTKTTGTPLQFQVSGSRPGVIPAGGDKGRASYGLKMYYRGKAIGAVDEQGEPVIDPTLSPRIYKDSALPISTNGGDKLKITWKADDATLAKIRNNTQPRVQNGWLMFVEVVGYNPSNSGATCKPVKREIRSISEPGEVLGSGSVVFEHGFPLDGCDYDTVKIKPWNMGNMQYSATVVDKFNKPMLFDNGMESIVSTGVSGKAKRELRVSLPRTGKTTLESEDFLFISGGDDLEL